MKPKLLCSKCSTELQWGDKFCHSCGLAIDWPDLSIRAGEGSAIPLGKGEANAGTLPGLLGDTCPLCGAKNRPDSSFCESCGVKLDSPAQPVRATQQEVSRKDRSSKPTRLSGSASDEPAPMATWKMVAGLAVFLIVGVLGLELLTAKRVPVEEHDHDHPPANSANMQVLPQIEALEKKISADPNDLQSILGLANLLQDNRFYDRAIVQYDSYLRKKPNDADALVDRGICYYDMGRYAEARSSMLQALKIDAKHVLGHFNLGIVSLREGNMKESNEWFRKTIALAPDSPAGQQAKQFREQHPAQ
jgi:cytochrome c-type biogenesis protein CcmH/NrfG